LSSRELLTFLLLLVLPLERGEQIWKMRLTSSMRRVSGFLFPEELTRRGRPAMHAVCLIVSCLTVTEPTMTRPSRLYASTLLLAATPILTVLSLPANACNVVGYKNGEPLCATTSDGKGQVYKDGRSFVQKRIANYRARQVQQQWSTRIVAHRGARW
jgi:hypothetical protein